MTNRSNRLDGLQARAAAASARRANTRVIVTRPVAAEDDGLPDVPASPPAPATAELWLYGTVGGYWWGFNSDDVADALRELGDVSEILVRLHSFGGSAIDGIAIANLLANHPANIRIVVDGIAASAASMIALAGSELIMSPGSQLMIHDAWTCVCGNAAELRTEAEWIDKQSQNYAETYAHRAGGTAEHWREVMTAGEDGSGTWYSAAEAVTAGLADRVENIASTTTPPPMPDPDDDDYADADDAAAAQWDQEVLIHPAARAAWSTWRRSGAPKPPAASADGSTNPAKKETAMAFTPVQLTQMRQDLGLAETADEATIVAALSEALAEQADPAATPAGVPEGMALIDTETLAEMQAQAAQGAQARAQQVTEHHDRVLSAAITAGKFPAARREHYAKLLELDPDGTEQAITALAANTVPVVEMGHSEQSADGSSSAYTDIYGKKGA